MRKVLCLVLSSLLPVAALLNSMGALATQGEAIEVGGEALPDNFNAGLYPQDIKKWDRSHRGKFKHHFVEVDEGVKLHYVTVGNSLGRRHRENNDQLVVFLHGWPNSWYHWRFVMPEIAKHYPAVAVEYRGACDSSKPAAGYDKKTMAQDIHTLVEKLGFERIKLVGFDIGLMVAYAYAAQYPEQVEHLVLVDAMLPGTSFFDQVQCSPRSWHFAFHRQLEVPEMLVTGRERQYLEVFYDAFSVKRDAITEEALQEYTRCYSKPGALTAGFENYRAFDQDVADNREFFKTKLQMPVLGLGSPIVTGPFLFDMLSEGASNVRVEVVPDTGHWIAEENPEYMIQSLLDFF